MDNKYSLPWIEKYRPHKIDDIIGHKQNIDTINKITQRKRKL